MTRWRKLHLLARARHKVLAAAERSLRRAERLLSKEDDPAKMPKRRAAVRKWRKRVQKRRERLHDTLSRIRDLRRFEPWMLNGHPGNVSSGVKLLILVAKRTSRAIYVTSTTDGGHASTSYHYPRNNPSGLGEAVDLGSGGRRPSMVKVQRALYRRGVERYNELFGPDNGMWVKRGQPIDGAEGSPLETLHDTHVHASPR